MAQTIHRKLMVGRYGPVWTERNTKPTWIVLHHTASGWNGSEATGGCINVWNYWYNLKPGGRVSSTDILGKNGYIMRTVDPLDSAWHAGSSEWNNKSIGIEIVNWGNNRDPFPEKQMRALAWLVYKYMSTYNIKKDHVTDHKAINSGKIDMRPNFPWSKLWVYVDEAKRKAEAPATIILPVPATKPPWWNKMLTWLKIRKRRR